MYIAKSAELDGISDYKHAHLHLLYDITLYHIILSYIVLYYIIQLCSGITCGRMLNGELYARRLKKLIYLHVQNCFMKISLQAWEQIQLVILNHPHAYGLYIVILGGE